VVIERTVADRPVRKLLAPLGSASSQSSPPSLAAARERFTAQGYVATTTEQIAERAGVSRPTVFASAVDLYFYASAGRTSVSAAFRFRQSRKAA